jgi:AhpD family alkylhydroperoxidase
MEPDMREPFIKRSFTAKTFLIALWRMISLLAWSLWAYLFRGIDRQLAEKILLVISSINDCRYCRWFHAHLALRSGIDSEQVEQILRHMLPQDIAADEQAALRFAMHYADSYANPDPAELTRLGEFYSPCRVKGIRALAAAIHFGNLCGNTFDAFLSRLRGQAVENGSIVTETLVFILCAPFLLPVMPRVLRSHGD